MKSDDTKTLPTDLSNELISLYRGWDSLEKKTFGKSIIDFDLAGQQDRSHEFTHRDEVLNRLRTIKASLESEGNPNVCLALVIARLQASICFLSAVLGERIGFDDYIGKTLGLKVKVYSEAEIANQREKLGAVLRKSRHKLSFNKHDIYRFQSQYLVRNNSNLPQQFQFFRERWLPRLLRRVMVPINEYKISVNFAREDAYWKNWISGDLKTHNIELKINVHERHIWYQGSIETLVIHEYCGHAIQMVNWHKRIENGLLPGFLGILTVHFPDQFILEGLAETLPHVLPTEHAPLDETSIVLRELHDYSLLVLNNLHVIANKEGIKAASDYALSRLPWTTGAVIDREIRDRTEDPLFRCYQYVYGIARQAFAEVMHPLTHEKKWEFLKLVYDFPMTPTQFHEMATKFA